MSEIPATSGDTKKQKTVSEKSAFEKFTVIWRYFFAKLDGKNQIC